MLTNEQVDSLLEDFDKSAPEIQRRTVAVLTAKTAFAEEVASWAQATLTALNTGDVKSGSLLHIKLREVMIEYRGKLSTL